MQGKSDTEYTVISAGVLLLFGLLSAMLVIFVHNLTDDTIIENELEASRKVFNDIIPENFTNDVFNDVIQVSEPDYLGTGRAVNVYRARNGDTPLGVVIHPVIADGYNGNIELGIGITAEGVLTGVRVTHEEETRNLGDQINQDNSDWIRMFKGMSYQAVPREQWEVESDGGHFDQVSGATITSRSVINAVRGTLDLHEVAGEGFYR